MFLLKYKIGDDVFYRITNTKQPSVKSVAFEGPLAVVQTKRINNALAMIEKALHQKEEKEEKEVEEGQNLPEVKKEEEKEAKKKMAYSVIHNFIKA